MYQISVFRCMNIQGLPLFVAFRKVIGINVIVGDILKLISKTILILASEWNVQFNKKVTIEKLKGTFNIIVVNVLRGQTET